MVPKDGVTFEAFEPLPVSLYKPCTVALANNDKSFFVAGGGDSGAIAVSKRVFIYEGNRWVEMKSMPIGRRGMKSNSRTKIDE